MHIPTDEGELRFAIIQIKEAIETQREIIAQRALLKLPTLEFRLECEKLERLLAVYSERYTAITPKQTSGVEQIGTRDR